MPLPLCRLILGLFRRSLQPLTFILVLWHLPAFAQNTTGYGQVWLQIEAHPSEAEAMERADLYQVAFHRVQGYTLKSGWYSITLGPFNVNEAAQLLGTLRSQNMIPHDSYLTDGREFTSQFWPVIAPSNDMISVPVPQFDMSATLPPVVQAPLPDPTPVPEPPPYASAQQDLEPLSESRANEAALSPTDKQDIQSALGWFGFYSGAIDGAFGSGTRAAISKWQTALNLPQTGYLTTRQQATLLGSYQADLAEYDFQTVTDEQAGVSAALPMALVEFERISPPFVQFRAKGNSGVTIMLISRPGGQAALAGLYDLLQNLVQFPADGPRKLERNSFSIQGADGSHWAQAYAEVSQNQVKGWMILTTPQHAAQHERVITVLQNSFRAIGDKALDPGHKALDEATRLGLIAGLELVQPKTSHSGVYVSKQGHVLSSSHGFEQCSRITLDRRHDAKMVHHDAQSNVMVLEPMTPLAPAQIAQWAALDQNAPPLTIAGYPYGHRLSSPILTSAQLASLRGLNGEENWLHLESQSLTGDFGAPVLAPSGAVVGLITSPAIHSGQRLPSSSNFARSAPGLIQDLQRSSITLTPSQSQAPLAPDQLNRLARTISVLVSCWP